MSDASARHWTGTPLDADVQVRTSGEMPVLDDELASIVEAIWNEERALRPALFNGRIFCADRVSPSLIVGHWTEYRRMLAQVRRPDLFARLKLRALAVNGLLECRDGLVLGRRHADAVYLAGCWQAAPAGNVEARIGDETGSADPDLAKQLLAELEEELGLHANDIEDLRPVMAIEHDDTHVLDVGFLLRTPMDFANVQACRARSGNAEYDALVAVPGDGIDAFVAENGTTLLPSVYFLIESWRKGLA